VPAPVGNIVDGFDRASLGSTWTNTIFVSGAAASGLVIAGSAKLARENDADYRQGAYYNASTFGPDLNFIADLSDWNPAAPNFEGVTMYARINTPGSGTTTGYFFDHDASSSFTTINSITAGVGSAALATTTQAFAAGDQIAFQLLGSRLSGWRKASGGSWTELLVATSALYNASGSVGFDLSATSGQVALINNMYVGPVQSQFNQPRAMIVR
jgi:hypothetical protein